jgi:His-Xaa-Ser system radical SAM maturase HxsC
MRELTGTAVNLLQPVIGVAKKSLFNPLTASKVILLVDQESRKKNLPLWRLLGRKVGACILSDISEVSLPESIPYVINVSTEDWSLLHEGDIILVEPDGKIKILYEIESPHNSLFVTNRCNCNCVMCPQPHCDDRVDLMEQNLFLISHINKKKTKRLGITGGEPTLLGDKLIYLIEECRKRLPDTSITLLTNGRKLSDFQFAKDIVRAGLPLMVIDIPLYADNDTEHDRIMGSKGSFYETIQGMHNLALLGQPVGLRTVLFSLTIERLVDYVEFVYRNLSFVFHVALMGMETTGLAAKNLDALWVDPYDYLSQLSEAVSFLNRRGLPVSIYNHQLCVLPPKLWPFARRSISNWKVSYPQICEECSVKDVCCGIFGTGVRHSKYLSPIMGG